MQLILSKFLRQHICVVVAFYIRIILSTCNGIRERGVSIVQHLWRRDLPFLVIFWHGRLLESPHFWHKSRIMNMLISSHQDGQCIASAIKNFQIRTIKGSSSRGGSTALRIMIRTLIESQESVGITPDGPKGPRMRVASGLTNLATLTSIPVIPISYASIPNIVVGSWDSLLIGYPFGQSIFIWGKPIIVPKRIKFGVLEAYREKIEKSISVATAEADHQILQTRG